MLMPERQALAYRIQPGRLCITTSSSLAFLSRTSHAKYRSSRSGLYQTQALFGWIRRKPKKGKDPQINETKEINKQIAEPFENASIPSLPLEEVEGKESSEKAFKKELWKIVVEDEKITPYVPEAYNKPMLIPKTNGDEVAQEAVEKKRMSERVNVIGGSGGSQPSRSIRGYVIPILSMGLAAFLLYKFFFKKKNKVLDMIETEINLMVLDVREIKGQRENKNSLSADLSYFEKKKVRNYFLSSFINTETKNRCERIEDILKLLGMEPLSELEKYEIIKSEEESVRQSQIVIKAPAKAASENIKSEKEKKTEEKEEVVVEGKGEDDVKIQKEPWWSELPYICLLVKKKNGAVYIVEVGQGGNKRYAVIAFEDALDANLSLKITTDNMRYWGVPAMMRKFGFQPNQSSKSGEDIEMIALTAKEYKDFLYIARIEGAVIPTDSLNLQKESNRTEKNIIKTIRQVCANPEWGIYTPMPKQMPKKVEDKSVIKEFLSTIKKPTEDIFSGDILAEEVLGDDQKPLKSQLLPETEISAPAEGNGATVQNNNQNELQKISNGNKSSNIKHREEEEKVLLDPPADIFSSMETEYEKSSDKPTIWWMALDTVYVPVLKMDRSSQGGAIQLNVSVDPEIDDFRTVGFEDDSEAKAFAGVFGSLMGPDALVGVIEMEPAKLSAESVMPPLVLAERTIAITQGMSKEDLIKAVGEAEYRSLGRKPRPRPRQKTRKYESAAGPKEKSPLIDDEMDEMLKTLAEKMTSDNKLGVNTEDLLESFREEMGERLGRDMLDNSVPKFGVDFGVPNSDEDDDLDISGAIREKLDKQIDQMMGIRKAPEPSTNKKPKKKYDEMKKYDLNKELGYFAEMPKRTSLSSSPSYRKDLEAFDLEDQDDLGSLVNSEEGMDNLIETHEMLEMKKEQEELEKLGGADEDGLVVVYPKRHQDMEQGKKGPLWFSGLPVVFVPHILDTDGIPKIYSLESPDNSTTYVLGFQDQNNAVCCRNLMMMWGSEDKRVNAAVIPMKPDTLIKACERESIQPIIFRKDTMPMEPGMSMNNFYQCAIMLANVQKGKLPLFTEDMMNDFDIPKNNN